MSELSVYECGTIVVTKLGNINGMITCFSCRFGQIIYEITYFDGEFKNLLLRENEFETAKEKTAIIGFKG